MLGAIKKNIIKNVSNIPGWRTKRRIIVIESDDWGSIRMSSKEAFDNLKAAGIPVDKNHYNSHDGLESNSDLEMLFEVLSGYRDATDRPPVMSGMNIMANPNFDEIEKNDFKQYVYEPFTETCKRYPEHNRVHNLWKEGIRNRLIIPEFHGREHLNVKRWMQALNDGCRSTHLAFENRVTGISRGMDNVKLKDYQAAFDIDQQSDLAYLEGVIESGLSLFEELFDRQAAFFIPTNGPFNNSLEPLVHSLGIKYLGTGKIQMEPLGNGQFRKNYRYLGKKSSDGILYMTRNAFFEPNAMGFPATKDWVNDCLRDIEIAFRWNKPATISSHRVNYIGWLNPENRSNGLKKLRELLGRILKTWPDVEFMTSVELGRLISSK